MPECLDGGINQGSWDFLRKNSRASSYSLGLKLFLFFFWKSLHLNLFLNWRRRNLESYAHVIWRLLISKSFLWMKRFLLVKRWEFLMLLQYSRFWNLKPKPFKLSRKEMFQLMRSCCRQGWNGCELRMRWNSVWWRVDWISSIHFNFSICLVYIYSQKVLRG